MHYQASQKKLSSSSILSLDALLIGKSKLMLEVKNLIRLLAPTKSTVLILAETGCGKELVARALQALSPRCKQVFLTMNCGAFAESLVDSELFGHEKGAFTGAVAKRQGKFESADDGTIFLDEIGETSLQVQIKLLRVLESGEIERLGGNKTIQVDVRVLAATNRDLEEAKTNGQFRHDLFYRLNQSSIRIPPLRERKEDIPLLVNHFLVNDFNMTTRTACISTGALEVLTEYSFPGNVRELKSIIESAAIRAGWGEITEKHLPDIVKHSRISAPSRLNMPCEVRSERLLSELKAVTLMGADGSSRLWHKSLKSIRVEKIHLFLVGTNGAEFTRAEFTEFLTRNGRNRGAKDAAAGRHLQLLRSQTGREILVRNTENANKTRYRLADRFIETH